MRNKNSKVRTTKRKLSKCKGVCRTHSDIQYEYANLLEKDKKIKEFQCNVVLDGLDIEGTYTTDFLIVKSDGEYAVRECVSRDRLTKPLNVKLLDISRNYWFKRGITDWGVVINASA